MEGPISFWEYKEQESNVILPEHDDDDEICFQIGDLFYYVDKLYCLFYVVIISTGKCQKYWSFFLVTGIFVWLPDFLKFFLTLSKCYVIV